MPTVEVDILASSPSIPSRKLAVWGQILPALRLVGFCLGKTLFLNRFPEPILDCFLARKFGVGF